MTRVLILVAIVAGALSAGGPPGARLMRQPDISRQKIAFIYAGDLWTAARRGGLARRLTTTAEVESLPKFSPDGQSIAFTR
jgi:tricorn protease